MLRFIPFLYIISTFCISGASAHSSGAQNCNDLTQNQSNPIVQKILLSQKLLDVKRTDNQFEEAVQFLNQNPHWPQQEKIAIASEAYINNNTDHKLILQFFQTRQPHTPNGYKFYAFAAANAKYLDAQTRNLIIKKGWIYGNFNFIERGKYLTQFANVINNEDLLNRIDERLWKSDTNSMFQIKQRNKGGAKFIDKKRALTEEVMFKNGTWYNIDEKYCNIGPLDKGYKETIKATIAAIQNHDSAESLFQKISPKYYIPSLIFHYLRWKKHTKSTPDSSLFHIISSMPRTINVEHNADEWYKLQNYWAREFLYIKEYGKAYSIMSKYCTQNHEHIRDAEWLSGWIALQFLHKPKEAVKHFKHFLKIVKKPISIARGYYWLGRSYAKMHDHNTYTNHTTDAHHTTDTNHTVKADHEAQAKECYTKASKYDYTFYGQLAKIELNKRKMILSSYDSNHSYANTSEVAKAIEILIQSNKLGLALLYMKCDHSNLHPYEIANITKMVGSKSNVHLATEFAKIASQKGIFMRDLAFPMPYNTISQINSKTQINSKIKLNRPLLKRATESQMPGDLGAQNRNVFNINEDLSTKSTKQLTSVVEFQKRSNKKSKDLHITYGITRQESVFDKGAISNKNAMGLMQLIADTARTTAKTLKIPFDKKRLTTDPEYNMKLGTKYFNDLLDERNGSYILALASYNTFYRNVDKWIQNFGDPRDMKNLHDVIDWIETIPFQETRNFVQRVLENIQVYAFILKKQQNVSIDRYMLYDTKISRMKK